MHGLNLWLSRARKAVLHPRLALNFLAMKAARKLSPENTQPTHPVVLSSEAAACAGIEQFLLEGFYSPEVGQSYGLDRKAKEELVESFRRNVREIPCATSWLYHVIMAREILKIPPEIKGDVIECGVWKGASTASLSLACRISGRRLIVCDSFEGLPQDDPHVTHQYPHLSVYGYYEKGMFAGGLDEVKTNIQRFGDLSVCEFVPGFFSESLVVLNRPLVFAFFDVDLLSSLQDCLRYVWPLLVEGGTIYTDDSCDMEVVRVWFDDNWWQRELGERSPGYVGSGCGLPLNPDHTPLGYTRKLHVPEKSYKRVPWLSYPDETPNAAGFTSNSTAESSS